MRIVAAEPQTRFVPALVEAAEPGKLQRARSRLARTGRGDIELEIDGGGAAVILQQFGVCCAAAGQTHYRGEGPT